MAFVEDFDFPKLNLSYLNVEIPRQRLQIERMDQSTLRAGGQTTSFATTCVPDRLVFVCS